MAITREQKEAQVQKLAEEFAQSKMTVLSDYKGLTVAEMQELRKQLKAEGGNYKIAKNTLIKLASTQAEALKDIDVSVFDGPMALAFGYNDEIAPIQTLANFAKTHAALEILGAIDANGTYLNAEQVKQMALLPSKDQLRAQLVGTLAAPLRGLATVLQGNLRGLATVVQAVADQKAKA